LVEEYGQEDVMEMLEEVGGPEAVIEEIEQLVKEENVAEVLELVDDIEDVSDEILCEVTVLTAQMDECIETE
jgi:thioredoxin-like negative regulator of GroEL